MKVKKHLEADFHFHGSKQKRQIMWYTARFVIDRRHTKYIPWGYIILRSPLKEVIDTIRTIT